MSAADQNHQSSSGGNDDLLDPDIDPDGFRVEERTHTEEYHQTKDVLEEEDRTEIRVREEKIVKLDEVRTRETVRLASPEEVRALMEAQFDGLDEIGGGKEVTVEAFTRTETTHERTVDGCQPVVETSVVEEVKSEETREEPKWKNKLLPFSSESETVKDFDINISFSADNPSSLGEDFVTQSGAPTVEAVRLDSVVSDTTQTADNSEIFVADVSMPDLEEISLAISPPSDKADTADATGRVEDKEGAKVEVETEMYEEEEDKEADKENDEDSPRRHEVRHKRHVIEEVIIEDSDKFYEKQKKRPKLFKGTLERKKEKPLATASSSGDDRAGGSLPNISVDQDQSSSAKTDPDGREEKPPAEKRKWYSLPRKKRASKTTHEKPKKSEAKKQQTGHDKSKKSAAEKQEEIVLFGGQKIQWPGKKKWGIQTGKDPAELSAPPEKETVEPVTFVVETEPIAAKEPAVAAIESPALVVTETSPPQATVTGKEKDAAAEAEDKRQSLTYVVEYELPKTESKPEEDDDKAAGGGDEEPLTVAYTVTTESSKPPLPETVEEKRRSWNPFGKKTELAESAVHESQTVTFVVEQDLPTAKVKVNKQDVSSTEENLAVVDRPKPGEEEEESDAGKEEKKKIKSWNLKWPSLEKKETKRQHQEEIVLDDTHLYTDDSAFNLKLPSFGTASKKHEKQETEQNPRGEESLTFVVTEQMPVVEVEPPEEFRSHPEDLEQLNIEVERQFPPVEVDVDGDKSGSWNLFGKIPSDETTIDLPETLTFIVDHDLPEPEVPLKTEKEHSLNLQVDPSVESHEARTVATNVESMTFVVEHDMPEAEVELGTDKEHSLNLQVDHSEESIKVKKLPTVTFVVEQEVTKPEIELDKEDHSSSFLGTLKNIFPKKSASADVNVEPETMTFTVERQVEIPEQKSDLEKEKERSWSLLAKVESLFPEKTSSKSSLEPEKSTPVTEIQPEIVTSSMSKKKSKPKPENQEITKSKPRRQVEIVVDDAHLFSDETNVKIKPIKKSGKNEKKETKSKEQKSKKSKSKEPQAEPSPETVTFVVTNEAEQENEETTLKTSVPEIAGQIDEVTVESTTFIVNEEVPTLETKTEETPEKEEGKSWKFPHITLPTLFHRHDENAAETAVHEETVTYVVTEYAEDTHNDSLEGQVTPIDEKKKADVEVKSSEATGPWTGKSQSDETTIDLPEPETLTFVVDHSLPEPEASLKTDKEHSLHKQVDYSVESQEARSLVTNIETVTFIAQHDLPEPEVPLKTDKEHSLNLQVDHSEESIKVKKLSKDAETVTFVVEQEVTKPEIELDKEDHSSSFLGTLKNIFPKKSASADVNAEPETMTFTVERQVEIPEQKSDLEKEKERSWSLLAKVESLFPEKTSSKSSLEQEKATPVAEIQEEIVTSVAEIQEEIVTSNMSKKKSKTKTENQELEKSKPRRQVEIVVDDAHLFSDETNVKIKPIKKSGKNEKKETKSKEQKSKKSKSKEPQAEPSPETVTFVVTNEAEQENEEITLKTSVPEIAGQIDEVTVESTTFIVNEEVLTPETKTEETPEKEEGKSWKFPHITLPSLFHRHDENAAETAVHEETVTYVVTEYAEDKHNDFLEGQVTPIDDEKKADVEVKSSEATGPWTGKSQSEETTIDLPEPETLTFVVDHSLPEPEASLKTDKEHSLNLQVDHSVETDESRTLAPNVETVTIVITEDAADKHAEGEVTPGHDKKKAEVEVRPSKATKTKGKPQKEIIVDDSHLYSEKSAIRWSPFHKSSPKAATQETPSRTETQETKTVTYTVTTDTIPADVNASPAADSGSSKGKQHRWRIFGKKKKRSSASEKSGSSGSLPSSLSGKDASPQPAKHRQDGAGIESQEFASFQPGELTVDEEFKDALEALTTGLQIGGGGEGEDVFFDVSAVEAPLVRTEIRGELHAERSDEFEDDRPKFDLGELRFTENVKQEYLDAPEPKRIVIAGPVNGFDEAGGQETEQQQQQYRQTVVQDEEEEEIEVKFETSTPIKDSSTGAHGDHHHRTLNVTTSSEASSQHRTSSQTVSSIDAHSDGVPPGSLCAQQHAATAEAGPPQPSMPRAASSHMVVVAIDFGTTFSGYAFSFSRDDVDSVHVMRRWPDGDPGIVNQKTPTVLLLTPDEKFHSFGFTAKDHYHNLNPEEAKRWLYFEKFKMALHYSTDLSTTTQIEAAGGRPVPALTVFSHALRFFRDHALREVSAQSATTILNEDVRWVITVPAIWKSPAKQFMRQAAYQAGIASEDNPDQLLVALEPEAASVFIRKQRLQQLIPESVVAERPVSWNGREPTPPPPEEDPVLRDRISRVYNKRDTNRWSEAFSSELNSISFQRSPSPICTEVKVGEDLDITGTKYMVADCGGGTVDITVYEMNSITGSLVELYKATGGPYGSMGVDLAFESLLVDIFGADFIDVFKAKRPGGWVDLMMAFESRKRAATPIKSKQLNVSLPFSFMDYHKKVKGSTVESAVRRYGNADIRWSPQGMLRLTPEAMARLFQPTLNNVKEAIANVLDKPEVQGVQLIFLVGGFAESPMVQVEMRQEFSDRVKILIPTDASLAILKGAVCFGNDPSVVKVRKSRMSYGLAVLNRFVRGRHPDSKLAVRDGVEWCVDVFDPLVVANQSVALGSSVTRSYTPAAGATQKFGLIDVYCSDADQVQFVTDPGVENCGRLRLDLSDPDPDPATASTSSSSGGTRRREVQAKMIFGDTEIKVVGVDVATGKTVRASIDFLSM